LKNSNSKTYFDSNLREQPESRTNFEEELKNLKFKITEAKDIPSKIKLLGNIGNHQRVLGQLEESVVSLTEAIKLAQSIQDRKMELVQLIRLATAFHWQNKFNLAHDLFDKCFESIKNDLSLNEYLDFVYQHKGKCFFDENKFELALSYLYEAFLIRQKKDNIELIDSSLLAIEETKRRYLPQVSESDSQKILSNLKIPDFVKQVIFKKHGRNLPDTRLNCINAALGFHGVSEINQMPAKPIELLNFLKKNTIQIEDLNDFEFGDFIVFWNRNGGTWDQKKIIISQINYNDPDFPYGLVFDHVAIRITMDIVFNKSNPSQDSEYKFDYFTTACYPSKLGKGFEITIHRLKKDNEKDKK
jgi:tetratricopeptide (TPR) repeat protein